MAKETSKIASDGKVSLPFVIWLLSLMAIVSAITILVCLYWLTSRLDQVAAAGSETLTDVILADTLEGLSFTVTDFSQWSLAYEIVTERREDEVIDVLGSSATHNDIFDQLFLLSADYDVIYEYKNIGADYPDAAMSLPLLKASLDLLPSPASATDSPVSGYVQLADGFSAVAMTRIIPDYLDQVDQATLPIMVGIIRLDEDWITDLATHSMQSGHVLGGTSFAPDLVSYPLTGPDGGVAGYIGWDHPTIGEQLRTEVMMPILLVCAAIFIVSFVAIRFFRKQHRDLLHLTMLASTDHLTGVLNRAGLDQIARSAQMARHIASGQVALIYLDMNDFKLLNDEYGHKAGDEALQAMATTLQAAVRETDVVARWGGDEFVCVIQNNNPKDAAQLVIDRLKALMFEPIEVAGKDYWIESSIGVAIASEGVQWDGLLRQADKAMYWAKRRNDLDFAFYAQTMENTAMAV